MMYQGEKFNTCPKRCRNGSYYSMFKFFATYAIDFFNASVHREITQSSQRVIEKYLIFSLWALRSLCDLCVNLLKTVQEDRITNLIN
jgi:hypothetical protein